MSSSDYSYDTDSDHDIDPVPKISPLNDDIRLTTIDYCRLAFFIAIIHCANNILQTTHPNIFNTLSASSATPLAVFAI